MLYWFVKNINQQKTGYASKSYKTCKMADYKTNRECIKCIHMHWFNFTTLSIIWKIILVNEGKKQQGKDPTNCKKWYAMQFTFQYTLVAYDGIIWEGTNKSHWENTQIIFRNVVITLKNKY